MAAEFPSLFPGGQFMPRRIIVVAFASIIAVSGTVLSPADEPGPGKKRIPWTTSKVRGSPEPPSAFRTELAFPKLKFDEPLDLNFGGGRLFVTERYGRVYTIPTDPGVEKPDLLIDFNPIYGKTAPKTLAVYGCAPHPQFVKNGYVYFSIVADATKEEPKGTRVSRFTAKGDPPVCDPKSELVIIQWPSGGHNGGCLQFGPDGFLYIGTGDSSGIADAYMTGQDLTSLAGKMLRIDVDHLDENKNYGIPKDNPFVATKDAKPEVFAYGLRQPWKYSFDSATGDLWCGNVGQDLWEQIYVIEKGGNYGWSILEGSHTFRPERPRGPTAILMPTVEHDHANFRSITGGFIYHGKRLPELTGKYIYGDYDTGRIWAFNYDRKSKAVSEHKELLQSNLRLVGFGQDDAGELYLCDHMAGRIFRLAANPEAKEPQNFPRRLSETGLFLSTENHQRAPGVIPYTVIAPQWCDGATKERFLALPGEGKMEFEAMLYPGAPGAPPGWKFPDGTVIAETLTLDTDAGKKRLETRILHHRRLTGTEEVGDQYWRGYTYIWNDEQTDAVLLEDPQGRDRAFKVRDKNGGVRTQTWHFPSRTECIACHNMAAKYAAGFQTPQMSAEQLRAFEAMDLFTKPLPSAPEEMPRLVDYRDEKQDLNLRARSYLHGNCGHCHRKWGGGNAEFQLLATWELGEMGIVGVRPAQGAFNMPGAKIVAAGDPYRSALFYRISTVGPGRMPRLGSSVIDEEGAKLIHDWISKLPATGLVGPGTGPPDLHFTGREDPDDNVGKKLEALFKSTSSALRVAHAIATSNLTARYREPLLHAAAASESPEVRDLFERFLPEEQRIKRLGAIIKPEQILALPGDPERGRKVFFATTGAQCTNCHRIGGKGKEVGPDLDAIGKKYTRAQILENILDPSKQIDPKYVTYVLETKRGTLYAGLLVSKDANKVVLKNSSAQLIEVSAADVEMFVPSQKSLMPDLLLRDMTAEQVADLTAFLSSLK
jgi:putative heme-binding domain-containing protein